MYVYNICCKHADALAAVGAEPTDVTYCGGNVFVQGRREVVATTILCLLEAVENAHSSCWLHA